MSDTAELVISCRGTGTTEVNRFTDAVRNADAESNKFLKTTGLLFSSAQMMRFGKKSVEAFKTQENASNALRSALSMLGKTNAHYQREMEKFSSEIQKSTIYGDHQITMLQAMGLNMGLNVDQVQDATKAAIGLSAAYGMDVKSALVLVARASKGHTETLSRYGIVLDKTKSKEEQYRELVGKGIGALGLAEQQTRTLSGALAQAGNVFGDAQEKIGAEFAPVIRDAAGLVKKLAEMFNAAEQPTRRFIVLTGTLTAGLTALKGAAGAKDFLSGLGGGMKTSGIPAASASSPAEKQLLEKGAEILNREMQNKEKRIQLVKEQEALEAQSEAAAQRLQQADRELAQSRLKLAEANRGVRETGADWRRSQSPEDYQELRYQMGQRTTAGENVQKNAAEVNLLKQEYDAANESVRRANDAIKDFDRARVAEKQYQQNRPEVRAAINARESVKSKDVLKKEAAATAAYNKELARQSQQVNIAVKGEAAKNAALARGATVTQANAVQAAVLAKEQKIVNMQSKPLGRAQLAIASGAKKVAVGFRTAAVAAKGLIVSMLPMLAISAAIAGIDYLLNKSKNAANAAADIAGKEADRARAVLETHDQERAADQDKLRRYEQLAGYQNRTNEEQAELVRLTSELNRKYAGLNAPLLEQNQTLSNTVDLWKKIREEQRKVRKEELKQSLLRSQVAVKSGFVKYGKDIESTRLPFWVPQMREKQGSRLQQLFQSESDAVLYARRLETLKTEDQIKELEKDIAFYAQKNNTAAYNSAREMLQMVKEKARYEKLFFEFQRGGGDGSYDTKKKREESERIKKLQEASARRGNEEYFEQYDRLREILNLETDRVKRKDQLMDLETLQLYDYDKEIERLNILRDQQVRSLDAAKREESFKTGEKLIEMTRKRAEIESNAVRQDYAEVQRRMEEERNFFNSIQQGLFRFRETASNAIEANSNEAIQLQSRQFLGGGAVDFQKQNAENTKNINELMKKMQQIEENTQKAIQDIRAKITGLQVSKA